MGASDDPSEQMYSQQQYAQASRYWGGLLGMMGSIGTPYAYIGGGGAYSGMSQQMYNAQMQEMQTLLGTPVMSKPTRPDPSEIAWLKGRVREIEWRPR